MFDDIRAYSKFASLIRREDRFGQSPEAKLFIDEFRSQLEHRAAVIQNGHVFFRTANAYEEIDDFENGRYDIRPCGEGRMLPQPIYALEGRVNPSGIVVLYMATSMKTAISEIRPWIDDTISVVRIEITREMKLVDLSKLHSHHGSLSMEGLMARFSDRVLPIEKINDIVWAEIDHAFSRPITRSETGAEYAPTQILAGAVRVAGFDGVAYKSSFGGENGYNVAIFGTDDVRLISGHLYQVKDIEFKAEESGNPWFRSQKSP